MITNDLLVFIVSEDAHFLRMLTDYLNADTSLIVLNFVKFEDCESLLDERPKLIVLDWTSLSNEVIIEKQKELVKAEFAEKVILVKTDQISELQNTSTYSYLEKGGNLFSQLKTLSLKHH